MSRDIFFILIIIISLVCLNIQINIKHNEDIERWRHNFLETEKEVLKMSLHNDNILDWHKIHFDLFYCLNEINLNNQCISEYYINYFSFNQKTDTTLNLINSAIEDNKKIINHIISDELLDSWKLSNPNYNNYNATFNLLYENILSYLNDTYDYSSFVKTSLTIKKSNMDVIQKYGILVENYINIKSELQTALDDIMFYDSNFIYEAFPEYTYFKWDDVL